MTRNIAITIKNIAMPQTVSAALELESQDKYVVWLNSNKDEAEKARAFAHECLHIYFDDFNSTESVDNIEQARHAIPIE